MERKPYPGDISDDEWALVAPYLTLMTDEAPQRDHSLREVFNGLRWIVRAGAAWRLMPHDLPPWHTVYQQSQCWLRAGMFEAIVHDLRAVLRLAKGRTANPRRRFSIAAHCNRRPKAATGRAMMGPNAAGARRCTWRWIPWAICWRSTSPRLMRRTAARSARWPKRCKRSLGRSRHRLCGPRVHGCAGSAGGCGPPYASGSCQAA